MWINPTTKEVFYLHSDIRNDCKDFSFPEIITDEMIEAAGYPKVDQTMPAFDPLAQTVKSLPPIEVDGKWKVQWQISDLPAEEAKRHREYEAMKAEQNKIRVMTAKNVFKGTVHEINRLTEVVYYLRNTGKPSVTWFNQDGSSAILSLIDVEEAITGVDAAIAEAEKRVKK